MWIVVIEMFLALGLAIFIVWWTMFHRPTKPEESAVAEQKNQANAPADDTRP